MKELNKRIKELAKQANCTIDGMGYGEGNIEQLTDLIINECAQVCLNQRDPTNLNYKPSERFSEAIKEHFGVK